MTFINFKTCVFTQSVSMFCIFFQSITMTETSKISSVLVFTDMKFMYKPDASTSKHLSYFIDKSWQLRQTWYQCSEREIYIKNDISLAIFAHDITKLCLHLNYQRGEYKFNSSRPYRSHVFRRQTAVKHVIRI